ncbi:hypothetical protein ES332_D01G134500v1 [Gossypium tomentosum]|uniref:Uncharacterized protein n=1 Tax=Gossypium tomentosum TaxID=34277 RepID=A0A5D2M937_GOSTO|nr:hypothetical protein ES332_D01G134500v1 [Gossypium tomentosum]
MAGRHTYNQQNRHQGGVEKESEQVKFYLSFLDLDLALLEDKYAAITDSSNEEEIFYHKQWERSNRLSIMFLRMIIANNIKTTIPQIENAKEYIMFVVERFRSTDKSLTSTLMARLTTMKHDGSWCHKYWLIKLFMITLIYFL